MLPLRIPDMWALGSWKKNKPKRPKHIVVFADKKKKKKKKDMGDKPSWMQLLLQWKSGLKGREQKQ